jgi:hypothetical protein
LQKNRRLLALTIGCQEYMIGRCCCKMSINTATEYSYTLLFPNGCLMMTPCTVNQHRSFPFPLLRLLPPPSRICSCLTTMTLLYSVSGQTRRVGPARARGFRRKAQSASWTVGRSSNLDLNPVCGLSVKHGQGPRQSQLGKKQGAGQGACSSEPNHFIL